MNGWRSRIVSEWLWMTRAIAVIWFFVLLLVVANVLLAMRMSARSMA